MLARLVRAGVDVFRLNSAHCTHDQILTYAARIRAVAQQFDRHVALMQDLAGPKIRCGHLAGNAVTLRTGRQVTLRPGAFTGDAEQIPINAPRLFRDLAPGNTILLADGTLTLKVTAATSKQATCRIVQGGLLRTHQGVNLPDLEFSGGAITAADRKAVKSGLEAGVDFFSVSFVQSAQDMKRARRLLRSAACRPGLIAKIERPQALKDFDAILALSDGIMVARGDLGIESDIARVPAIQKRLIRRAKARGRFAITATQMLESMTHQPHPTRAEATDVANAVWDGSDALMLSAETAVGRHPVRVVQMMARIIAAAESEETYRGAAPERTSPITALARAAVDAAMNVGARAILVFTESGATAARIALQRPLLPILAATSTDAVARALAIRWGVEAFTLKPTPQAGDRIAAAETELLERRWCRKRDRIILVTGSLPVHGLDYTIKLIALDPDHPGRFHETLVASDMDV